MKGGFNKVMRNIAASTADSEFEKVSLLTCLKFIDILQRLTKATFQLDSKEPKEKHVVCKSVYSHQPNF